MDLVGKAPHEGGVFFTHSFSRRERNKTHSAYNWADIMHMFENYHSILYIFSHTAWYTMVQLG